MRSFRERNPVVVGAVGLALVAAMLWSAFNLERLPLVRRGTVHAAAFSEAGGLRQGDEVRVAGVKVGKVTRVALVADHVRVEFRVGRDTQLGDRSGAAVRVKTILGQKYLALLPSGQGRLRPAGEIPLDRTVSVYDVVQAVSDLTTTTERIDTARLAKALDTIAAEFRDSPREVGAALSGLSRLSRTVASRDQRLRSLLRHAGGVTKVLADRDQDLVRLVKDGDLLLQEVQARREVIHQLLLNTTALAQQLTALAQENQARIGPALERLGGVLDVLQRNQSSLERSIQLLAPFVRVFANTLGNGRWFDTFIQNLVAVPGTVASPGSAQVPPRSPSRSNP